MTAPLLFPKWVAGRPTIEFIQRATAEAFGITRAQILGDNRARAISRPRQIAMLLAYEQSPLPQEALARHFRRDHSTIRHGVGVAHCEVAKNAELYAKVAQLRRRLIPPVAPPPDEATEPIQLDFLPGPLFDFAGAM